jgi:hypothetical protein
MLLLAAIIFAVGFRQVPLDGRVSEGKTPGTARALRFLILGNIFWILGEEPRP